MQSFNLVVVKISDQLSFEPDIDLIKSDVAKKLMTNSGNRIELIVKKKKPIFLSENNDVLAKESLNPSAKHLNVALQKHTSNRRREVKDLILIYASHWKFNKELFGMMFDANFSGGSISLSDENGIPREGCVVFVDALKSEGYEEKDIYRTTIHELGHVFNLWHDTRPNQLSIMSQSTKLGFSNTDYYQNFISVNRKFLTDAGEYYVMPGGYRFGIRGPLGNLENKPFDRKRSRKKLKLLSYLPRQEYLPGEPIVLDVIIQPKKGIKKIYKLPNELDPGFDRFQIWVERPSGERVRYSAPQYYCGTKSLVKVTTKNPLRNNISIFWGANGLTFDAPGNYKIECLFVLNDDKTILRSKPVEVKIKSSADCTKKEAELSKQLCCSMVSSYLYFRGELPDRKARTLLQSIVKDSPEGNRNTAYIDYVLARGSKRISKKSNTRLKAAIKSGELGTLSSETAQKVLNE